MGRIDANMQLAMLLENFSADAPSMRCNINRRLCTSRKIGSPKWHGQRCAIAIKAAAAAPIAIAAIDRARACACMHLYMLAKSLRQHALLACPMIMRPRAWFDPGPDLGPGGVRWDPKRCPPFLR